MNYIIKRVGEYNLGSESTLVVLANDGKGPIIPIAILYYGGDPLRKSWKVGLLKDAFAISEKLYFRREAVQLVKDSYEAS